MKRIQKDYILSDLAKKMVFLAGPRQAGKTWLAKEIAKEYQRPLYLNYDNSEHRNIILEQAWLNETDLLILDELHKMPGWKNYLKGVYDTKLSTLHMLVTGSARLDLYHQVGDSLAGRYFLHHLFPLSLAELKQVGEPVDMPRLLERGGFPEPYLASTNTEAKRWRLQYTDSLIRTDVLDFNNIANLRAIQLIFNLLRRKVGSPISYKTIAEDVQISPHTVKKYIEILEAIYIIFRITPHSNNIARSLLKEPKIYFYDNGLVEGDEGAIFENFVANALMKHVAAKVDYAAENYQLKYFRTKDGREIDFVLVNDQQVESIIEVKSSDKKPGAHLSWAKEKYNFKSIQLVKHLREEHQVNGIEIRRPDTYLSGLIL
jgi:predicted AAA+ superfamily ATPase